MKRKWLFLALAAFLAFASIALASSAAFELPWFTVDSGGGTASGGAYTLVGAIGQADADILSGGAYTLIGGFWSGAESLSFRYLPVIMR